MDEILLENEIISHFNNTLAIGEIIKINVFSMLKTILLSLIWFSDTNVYKYLYSNDCAMEQLIHVEFVKIFSCSTSLHARKLKPAHVEEVCRRQSDFNNVAITKNIQRHESVKKFV